MQYTHNSLAAIVVQPLEALAAPVAVLSKDIKAWPSNQMEDIKDELEAVFKAHGKTAEDEADKVNKTKLLELSAKEVARMGLFAISIIQEFITAIPKLDFKVINLLNKLIFATQHTNKPINGTSIRVKFNGQNNQNKDTEYFAYYTLADQISIIFSGCKSKQDLLI